VRRAGDVKTKRPTMALSSGNSRSSRLPVSMEGEGAEDYFQGTFGEGERVEVVDGAPLGGGGVGGGLEGSGEGAADVIDEDVVVLGAA
jgi:hypothetical protein